MHCISKRLNNFRFDSFLALSAKLQTILISLQCIAIQTLHCIWVSLYCNSGRAASSPRRRSLSCPARTTSPLSHQNPVITGAAAHWWTLYNTVLYSLKGQTDEKLNFDGWMNIPCWGYSLPTYKRKNNFIIIFSHPANCSRILLSEVKTQQGYMFDICRPNISWWR